MKYYIVISSVILLTLDYSVQIGLSFAFPKTNELGFHKTCPTGYELHVDKAIDWFWMKSAGSQTVLAPSFPQNGTLTENVTRNTPGDHVLKEN